MNDLGELEVSYGQVGFFQAHLPNPFNDWRPEHLRQGFSWRPGSVSFSTLDYTGPLHVSVGRASAQHRTDAARIIRVPFTVDASGDVEVATIEGGRSLSLKPGEYSLVFEHGRTPDGRMWACIGVEPVTNAVTPQIILADAQLTPGAALVMEAEAATP